MIHDNCAACVDKAHPYAEYPHWLHIGYLHYPQIIECKHCGETRRAHVDDSCLFLPTKYEQLPIEALWERRQVKVREAANLKDRYSRGQMAVEP